MCVFLIRKMETLIFSLLENTFLNCSFDEKQEIAKRGKCYEKPCQCLHVVEQKQLHTNFLLFSLMRHFGLQILFYAIWSKGFLDHAHLTDGMQWQKKSKKHTYMY